MRSAFSNALLDTFTRAMNMRVLLIQTPQVTRDVISLKGIEMPMNLAYLASGLEHPGDLLSAYGHDVLPETLELRDKEPINVRILDLQFYQDPWRTLSSEVRRFKPSLIGITSFTIQAKHVDRIAQVAKERDDDVLITFGGPHASALPGKSLSEMPHVDVIVVGEGELTLLEIAGCVFSKNEGNSTNDIEHQLSRVKGIYYRDAGDKKEIKASPPRPLIKNLDLIPFPARDKLHLEMYKPLFVNYWRLPSTGILSSRGCPYNCSYCSKAVFKRKFRMRSPENVLEEMRSCEKKYGIKDFRFYDDAVTISRHWVKKFCKLLIDQGTDYTWNAFSRVSDVTPAMLKLMKRAGCYHLKFGVETGSNHILKQINKTTTLQDARNAIKHTDEAGMESLAYFIINFPGESIDSMLNTIKFAKELNATYAMFFHCKPLPGSKIYADAVRDDTLIHTDWEYYGEEDPPVLRNQASYRETRNILRDAYNQYYLRPRYLMKWVKDIGLNFSIEKLKRLFDGIKTFMPSRRQ